MGLARALDAAAGPLDRARAALLALALRAGLGPVLARRDRRLALIATLGVIVALGLTVVAPIALFVVGPVLLGVPHVASDLRYLVVRRGIPAPVAVATAIACAAFVGVRVVAETGVAGPLLRLELALASAWILAAMLAGAFAGRSPSRLAVALPLLGVATVAALRAPVLARYVFLHAHNLVAIGVWIALFRRAARRRGPLDLATIVAVVAVAAATALLVSGVTLRWTYFHGAWRSFGLDLGDLPRWLAPGLSPRLGLGVAASYIFLQSIHYEAWLGWIPQDDVRAEGTLTFRMTARALAKDFGALGLAAIALAMIAVLGGALVDARRARDLYVSLAMFHTYLELAMIGFFLVRGRGLSTAGAPLPLEASAEGAAA
jgi:hypothetical protein